MAKRRPIITIDCETDPFKRGRVPQPFLWGLYDGERYRDFPDARSMMKYLTTLGPVIVYAHNGGKFDYNYLYEFLEPYTEVLIISGRVARFQIGEAEFRDSWNILPVPLRAYKKDQIDITKLEADVRDRHLEEIKRYNAGDCRYLWELVEGFVASYGTCLTLAGAAMKFWSKHFGHEIPHSKPDFYHRIKPFYCGGRVQCFQKGIIEKPFHVVDVNSAYPFAMTHKHPLSIIETPWTPKRGEKIIPQSVYTLHGVSRGALPWKNEANELTFPDDDTVREYHVTGWELQAALDTKRLSEWEPIGRKDFLKEIDFNDYVDHFYAMKAAAPKASKEYIFAKLMQNSLYGKFGANPEHYSSYGIIPHLDIVECERNPGQTLGRNEGPWTWAGTLGTYALMEGKDPATGIKNPTESDYFNVATAASITGYVRAHLLRHVDAVERQGGTVLYCDTDSIVYQLDGSLDTHPFRFSKKLGDWSYEGRFDFGAIAGKKLYAFHYDKATYAELCAAAAKKGEPQPSKWKTAHKGVKLEAKDIVTIANGGEVLWEADAPVSSPFRKLKKGETVIPARFMHRLGKRT